LSDRDIGCFPEGNLRDNSWSREWMPITDEDNNCFNIFPTVTTHVWSNECSGGGGGCGSYMFLITEWFIQYNLLHCYFTVQAPLSSYFRTYRFMSPSTNILPVWQSLPETCRAHSIWYLGFYSTYISRWQATTTTLLFLSIMYSSLRRSLLMFSRSHELLSIFKRKSSSNKYIYIYIYVWKLNQTVLYIYIYRPFYS
jgi:hypothetical protein